MKLGVLTFLFLVISFVCSAQNELIIKGIVRGENGGPIAGATVSTVEAELQIKTDSYGMFTITVPDLVKRLQVESPGYHKLVQVIDGQPMVFNLKIDKDYASRAYQYALIEEKLARDTEKRIAEEEIARIKAERNARRKEIDAVYNCQYKNIGFVHTLEFAYGYQLADGDLVYKNLGFRNYGSLDPIELTYTFAYRFHNVISLGIGTGLQYQTLNLKTYGDEIEPEYQGIEDFTPVNVPLFLNTKIYLSRGKFQPLFSLSGGVYLPNAEPLFDIGIGANMRVNKNANVYFLISCRTTPFGDFREYNGNEGLASRPPFYVYYPKVAWTPSFKFGFTL